MGGAGPPPVQTEALQSCDFPGNVRKLNNLMELSIDDCGIILGGDTDRARSRKASPEVIAFGVRRAPRCCHAARTAGIPLPAVMSPLKIPFNQKNERLCGIFIYKSGIVLHIMRGWTQSCKCFPAGMAVWPTGRFHFCRTMQNAIAQLNDGRKGMKTDYKKLWKILIDKEMTRSDLRRMTGMSAATMAKLGKSEMVSMELLKKICEVLECNIGDIMDFLPEMDASKQQTGNPEKQ